MPWPGSRCGRVANVASCGSTSEGGRRLVLLGRARAGPDGKRRQKVGGWLPTRKDAERAFGELCDEVRSGRYVEPSKTTLGQFLTEEWLPGIRASLAPTTLDHYRRNVEAHLVPRLGALPLQHLTPAKLNAFYADVLAAGRRDGRGPISPKTVRHLHTTLHKALGDAVRWGRLTRNPADLAEPLVQRGLHASDWVDDQFRGGRKRLLRSPSISPMVSVHVSIVQHTAG